MSGSGESGSGESGSGETAFSGVKPVEARHRFDEAALARMHAGIRCLRLADGPDEVHRRTVAQRELRKHAAASTAT